MTDTLRIIRAVDQDLGQRTIAVTFGLELALAHHVGEEFAKACVDELIRHVGLPPRPPEPPEGYAAREYLAGWKVPTLW